jgi:hypothetical protein
MPLVCPQCQQTYEKHNICPLCNVVLLFHAQNLHTDSSASSTSHHVEDEPSQWQQTPWGKILIGLILAQGLSHGLRQLLTAGFLASDGADVWRTLFGLVLLHSIHAVSLLIGGALTGAGQSRGVLYGAMVGFVNGMLTLFFFGRLTEGSLSVLILAEPVMHMAMGALGGGLGMLIWRPAPKIPELESSPTTSSPLLRGGLDEALARLFVGPVHVGRVCTGALVVIAGVVWSNAILEFLLRASQGTFSITSHLQAKLVTLEISALAVVIGAAFAGATTINGVKQGLFVGIFASIVVLGLQLSNPKIVFETIVFTASGIVMLTLVGGWFGSQLFPPLDPNYRRRKFSYYA